MIDINNIEQLKRTATDCYFRSVDIKALVDGLNSVVTLLNQPVMQSLEDKSSAERLSQPIRQFLTENKTALRVLAHRIKLKVKVLKYVTRGYLESAYQEIIEYAKEVVADSERGNYPKTALLAKNVTAYMEKVYAIMFDAESHQNRVFDSEGNSVITSIEQGQSVKTIFDAKIAQASMLESGVNLFGEQVAFISVRDAVVADLKEVSNSIGSQVARMAKQKESELIKKSAVEVENRFDDYEYYPVIADDRRANAVVICTPIRDEFLLYAYFSGKSNPAGISIVDLSKVNSGALGGILGAIRERGADLAVINLRDFGGEDADLFNQLIAFSKTGRKVYIHDVTGDRVIYNEMLMNAQSAGTYTALDVSFVYLSMPASFEIIELFRSKKMIGESDEEKIKNSLPFAGFIGLNEMVKAWALNRNWLIVGKEISLDNMNACKNYLAQAPSQNVLIDIGWGDFMQDREVVDAHYEFDYDGIREYSIKNVRKIMEHNCTFFAKCGMLVRYALFRLEDESVWKNNLSVEEKRDRLEEATKLLYKALRIPFEPVVVVKKVLDVEWAGGLCCDGGKLIQYKENQLNNCEWLAGCVCHESYHTFQHQLEISGFKNWHWHLLGVTKGGIESLKYNHKARCHYNIDSIRIDVKDYENAVYKIQLIESEARAFDYNCMNQSLEEMHKIDWE